jgi:exopolysaccharide biosynthesis polyprenyl glycosylphosphotransferase
MPNTIPLPPPPAPAYPPSPVIARKNASRNHRIGDLLVLCGLAGDSLVWLLSVPLFSGLWFVADTGHHESIPQLQVGATFAGWLALLGCLAGSGLYHHKCLLNRRDTLERIARALFLWLPFFLALAWLFPAQQVPAPHWFSLVASGLVLSFVGWRLAFHRLVTHSKVAHHLRQRIVLVGWTPESGRLAQLVWANQTDPCEIVGYVDFAPGHGQVLAPANIPYLGDYTELPEILHAEDLDIALLTDLNAGSAEILQLATLCEREMIEFKIIPSYFQILVAGLHLETISGTPVLSTSGLPLNKLHNRILKRVFDLAGASFGLLVSIPAIIVFGAIVYRESPGPIFYKQRRLGRKGRSFEILKIRSMRLDAEKDGKVGWSTKVDDRRLKIGSFMRKWNIDELPQFWNVLKGDMSLVGPRPERPELIKDFKHQIAHYNARHTIKPGITGWAQVNGLRGDTDLTERIQHDLFYAENWSLVLDLRTMFLTFFKRDNAC